MMSGNWDTIVIGAGLGGLTAAAKLVKEGLRVLVLDRSPHPGGTAYVYHRKGFSFPMGPLGFSNPALIRETLKDLEDGNDIDLSRVHYRIRAFDLDIPISLPFSVMVKELSRLFPSDAQGIEQFYNYLDEIISAPSIIQPDGNAPIFKKAHETSALEYLRSLVNDSKLRRILGSIGTREPYSGLTLLAAMWNLMVNEGIWYPKEGMQPFCQGLAKAVGRYTDDPPSNEKQRGQGGIGEIRLNKEVAKIRVEKGKALGVTLKDGTQIDSGSVISNADYKTTFIKLLGPEAVLPEWYHAVSNAKQTGSVFQVCLGLDSNKIDLSVFEKADRVIYKRNKNLPEKEDLHWNAAEIDSAAFASQELEVNLWGREDKFLAPQGGSVIVIRTEAEHSHFTRFRSLKERRVPEYQEYKTRLGHALVREIEHLIPGMKNAIRVMDVATPLTFEDQGGRSGGAVAGWSWDYDDFQDNQPKELIRTPIKGLYMAGYQAFSALFMGGVPTAIESGKRATKAVLEDAEPTDEILIPLPLSHSSEF